MTFIPNKTSIKVGDQVILIKPVSTLSGMFTIGHIFKVINDGERGLDLMDKDGNKLLEMGLSSSSYEKYNY
jgi:hypothetical protein